MAEFETEGRFALPRPLDFWYVACTSAELGQKPRAVRLLGTPLVLFRDRGGTAAALLDRCAHRNVPLSLGRVQDDTLECAYHGWRFGRDGVCHSVPALLGEALGKARRVASHAVVEAQGYVWVYARADVTPTHAPYRFARLDTAGYRSVRYAHRFNASLYATAENILDVPHTAFLHRGLFRGKRAQRVTAVIRRESQRVEVEYVGEKRPQGLIGRILAPKGGAVAHFDRFLLPSIAEVEYRLGERSHILVANALTPVDDFVTDMFTVVSFKLPLGWLVQRVAAPIAHRVVAQDAHMLAQQTASVRAFGGEQYASTDVDVMSTHILKLLRQAERGELPPVGAVQGAASETRVELHA